MKLARTFAVLAGTTLLLAGCNDSRPAVVSPPSTSVVPTPYTPAPTPAPVPVQADPPATYYANCAAVKAAGKAPLISGSPGYRDKLDADHDGIACES